MKKVFFVSTVIGLISLQVQAKNYIVTLHHPSNYELKLVQKIIKETGATDDRCSDKDFAKNYAEDCLTEIEWHVARVHLDKAEEPEFIIAGDGLGWSGASNSPLDIYKHSNGKWIQILGEDRSDLSLEVYDHKTNGFNDVRELSSRFRDIYDGTMYQCPECRPDTLKNADYNYFPKPLKN